jgi:hypothetical protein
MCPSKRNALLSSLGDLESSGSKVIKFDVMYVKPHFPYHVSFQIHVKYSKYTIKCAIVDEGTVTCVMYLACWKDLGSLTLSKSLNMLTTFDESFLPPSWYSPFISGPFRWEDDRGGSRGS